MTYAVTFDGCQGCGACLLTCPVHAIRPTAPVRPGLPAQLVARPDLCTGCGECVEVCPVDAITVHPITALAGPAGGGRT